MTCLAATWKSTRRRRALPWAAPPFPGHLWASSAATRRSMSDMPAFTDSESAPLDPLDLHGLEDHPLARAIAAGDTSERGVGQLIDLQIYRDLFEYIVLDREPESSGRRNLDTMRLLDAVQRSSAQGEPVAL